MLRYTFPRKLYKDKQGKAFRQYQNISEKESFGHLLSQRF